VSKLQEAREAMARDQADPSLTAELDDVIARVTQRSREDSNSQASIQSRENGRGRTRPFRPGEGGTCPLGIGYSPYFVVT
jgi:hypothetical protein